MTNCVGYFDIFWAKKLIAEFLPLNLCLVQGIEVQQVRSELVKNGAEC